METALRQECQPEAMDARIIGSTEEDEWEEYTQRHMPGGVYLSWAWQEAVARSYGHRPYYLAAYQERTIRGILPLICIRAPWGGGKLVSLPFCDYGGLLVDNKEAAQSLLDQAVALAGRLKAGLEIRTAAPVPALEQTAAFHQATDKCRMLLELPPTAEDLWKGFKAKLRSQIRRPEKAGLKKRLGHRELLADFYQVFARNMRDLGSPVHSRNWVENIIAAYGERVKVGVVYKNTLPVAGGILLLQGETATIPWASTLREYNNFSPNMMLYWTFLEEACRCGCRCFDFGRSTPEEGTYNFKKQWGARPAPLYWYVQGKKHGQAKRGDHPARELAERLWRHLPLPAANLLGPMIRKHIAL